MVMSKNKKPKKIFTLLLIRFSGIFASFSNWFEIYFKFSIFRYANWSTKKLLLFVLDLNLSILPSLTGPHYQAVKINAL